MRLRVRIVLVPVLLALTAAAFSGAAAPARVAAPTGAAKDSEKLDQQDFRYERELRGPSGRPLLLKPDAALLGHSRIDLSDIRVTDAKGMQVPWRISPRAVSPPPETIPLLDVGWEDGVLVALLDLGEERRIVNRLDLGIPGSNFVGKIEVFGSDDRVAWRSLGQTLVYDLRGAKRSRSTSITFRRSDLRYLELRARGVPTIRSAQLRRQPSQQRYRSWEPRSIKRKEAGRVSVVTIDLGYRLPVSLLDVQAATDVYERPLVVVGSDDGRSWMPVADARLFRFAGTAQEPIEVGTSARFLRFRIRNGDDKPLGAISVRILADTPILYVASGSTPPYRLLYGARLRSIVAPDYDLTRVPPSALSLDRAATAAMGAERKLQAPEAETAESLLDRFPWLIEAALGIVALAFGAAGLLVFRSKA